MAEFKQINIDNSTRAAIKTGNWSNPGAKFYDQLLNSFSCEGEVPEGPDEMKEMMKNGKYVQWDGMLKEAYLIAPIKDIKNSPYGVTPFSRSGCKYPHHVIKGGKLVLSVPGVKAAYARLCQMKECTGEAKAHIIKHMEELGLKSQFHHGQLYWNEQADAMDIIESNFHAIYESIKLRTGLDLASMEDFENSVITEAVVEGGDNPVVTSDIFDEIGKTPESIYTWMRSNISYDKTITGWKLRTPAELYQDKMGNCHDQSYFLACMLHSLGYINGQLFFVEFKEDSEVGGNTHTLTWYRDKLKQIFWVENAWEDQAGIHGPYADIADLKSDILSIYNKDNDINSHKFDGIVFSTLSNYRTGMSLGEYVESWRLEDDHLFTKEQAISEAMDFIDAFVNDEYFRENVDISTMDDLVKKFNTPEELLKWMDCIKYGWIDKNGKVNGTGENDSTEKLCKEYKLQSPLQLMRSKVGLCWDQVELERVWFEKKNIPYAIIFVEVDDGEDKPTHTFLIYKDPGDSMDVYWFDHAWREIGIKKYKDLKGCLTDAIQKTVDSFNTKADKIIIRKISKPMKAGIGCEKYYKIAEADWHVDMGDIQYDEILNESTNFIEGYTIDTLPDKLYFSSPNRISGKYITKQTKRGIFMSPDIGISSMFAMDRQKILRDYIKDVLKERGIETDHVWNKVNLTYDEWGQTSSTPLKEVHMYHNCPDFKEVRSGKSSGYIYEIDVSKVKDKLTTHGSQSIDNEVIYNGDEKLPIIKVIPHTIKWTIGYKPSGGYKGEIGYGTPMKESVEFTEGYSLDKLPDVMYFASPNAIPGKTISAKAPRGLFLTPYLGIASLFVVDRHRVLGDYINKVLSSNGRELYKLNANVSYKEWEDDSKDLDKPIGTAHLYHNIPDFKETTSGTATGFIYQIDVSKVKNELITYSTNNPDREVIYKGDGKLPIMDHMVHTINWSIGYKPGSWKGSFESKAKSKEVKESMMYESGIVEGQGITGDDLDWITNYLMEEGEVDKTPKKKQKENVADVKQDSGKNGVRRKQLYIAFIEWAKEFNPKNTFGSIFDKDAFEVSYPFIPNDMRYFYRLANPLLCVLDGDLTFFQVSELRKLNEENPDMESLLIFAATNDDMRVFNSSDNKIYKATEDENGGIELGEVLGDTFDLYIQSMIGKGDILNSPTETE